MCRSYKLTKVRPWLKLNGELNSLLLKRFQEVVLTYVMINPGAKEVRCGHEFGCCHQTFVLMSGHCVGPVIVLVRSIMWLSGHYVVFQSLCDYLTFMLLFSHCVVVRSLCWSGPLCCCPVHCFVVRSLCCYPVIVYQSKYCVFFNRYVLARSCF